MRTAIMRPVAMGQASPIAHETEPHVFTSRGHLPASRLQYATAWQVGEDVIQFTETYTLDGEVVKQSVHVYDRSGVTGAGAAATF